MRKAMLTSVIAGAAFALFVPAPASAQQSGQSSGQQQSGPDPGERAEPAKPLLRPGGSADHVLQQDRDRDDHAGSETTARLVVPAQQQVYRGDDDHREQEPRERERDQQPVRDGLDLSLVVARGGGAVPVLLALLLRHVHAVRRGAEAT